MQKRPQVNYIVLFQLLGRYAAIPQLISVLNFSISFAFRAINVCVIPARIILSRTTCSKAIIFSLTHYPRIDKLFKLLSITVLRFLAFIGNA